MIYPWLSDDELYDALLNRALDYDGRAFVGVTSTRIFCRLSCPARKPKRENCLFFETVGACMEAGFRPCKRCRPLESAAQADPLIARLLKELEAQPGYRWSEADLVKMGLDLSTVRRSFKRQFGMTFLEMARLRRVQDGVETLARGGRVIDAQLDAGFDSASGFRTAFARLLGDPLSQFSNQSLLKVDWIKTPLGPMIAVSDKRSLHLLEFFDRKALPNELKKLRKAVRGDLGFGRFDPIEQIQGELKAYFAGELCSFQTPLSFWGSPFTKSVWQELQRIPMGQTRSYSQIAALIGRPSAVRAVARANGANQLAIVVPCHRVIGAGGDLTGYGGGLWRKQKLIDLEHRTMAALAIPLSTSHVN
ncbi:methylated-DNA--protein-cysteine methyltransferase [Iodidimonas muriae]|uniref:Methylated-DNA--protein-cysteine methyltransferase n=1 Tax=Iodidimonas muriae TaxID=261467 RepID=A0ABQ2LBD8_9PROT|nr:methylated-DNA--protein-cysteine methyltransferase [Kordiimonadales bacterium JCM 17843]GGO09333.1 methylated-DNA--protein-cysteine methyltransferase [Iodidimonas muriae]